MDVGPRIILRFDNGFYITETAIWAVIVAVAVVAFCLACTRNLKRDPKGLQAVAELIIEYVYSFVRDSMGKRNMGFAPYIGTLFIYLLVCNAIGLLGFRAPTADLNFTVAMGILVFFLIQINSMRAKGVGGYFKHFAQPYPFMIPINVLEEFTFPISLSFRIFGNILAGVIVMELLFELLGFVSMELLHLPIPLFQAVIPLPLNAFFDIFEPALQAFVFCMLTMSFIEKANVLHHED
ncbi:MAG: F0F1 ATP synthase subunit A [Clostridiales Family XIII bacterium]|jgi:F-type H+-transporting ATPase subunit a|nr:F0F1 ATP synthase subunit A [Clostridiales Family XIII bacterium]